MDETRTATASSRNSATRRRAQGDEPYASRYDVTSLAVDLLRLPDGESLSLAGRLMLWRRFGGIAFGQLQDRSGRVQISIRKGEVADDTFTEWTRSLRIGDFVGVKGVSWTTDKGERTLRVESLSILGQPQRSLPEKWAGLGDPELKSRKRYLDLLVNEHSRARFVTRSRIVSLMRGYLDSLDFLEVETPILQQAASGAAARPFVTHHNALGEDLYLRISPETYLKRLVAGGLDRVYEIAKNFRNEGIDASHLQEFTMIEWYVAYWDYRDNMRLVQNLVQQLVREVGGGDRLTVGGTDLNFSGDWPVLDFREELLRATGIDLRLVRTLKALQAEVAKTSFDVDLTAPSYAALVDQLYKKALRPSLIQPCFVVGQPVELVPLARRSDGDPTRLDMFQVLINSWEIAKAYSELVDPADQVARLEEQARLRAAGDDETMMLEPDFIEAMEYGMPPMSGVGIGVDRLVALLTDAANLRDVVLFPSLKSQR